MTSGAIFISRFGSLNSWKLPITALNSGVIVLLSILLAGDLGDLFG